METKNLAIHGTILIRGMLKIFLKNKSQNQQTAGNWESL